jgi:hypothetical protein
MQKSKYLIIVWMAVLVAALSACQRERTGCLVEGATPRPALVLADLLMTPAPEGPSGPVSVEIKGKEVMVDKLVDYPLCNDTWRGIVYMSCQAQVALAELDQEDNPLFLAGCNLDIAPNTIVYVEAHNDAAYYKGCSCHTGEDPVE